MHQESLLKPTSTFIRFLLVGGINTLVGLCTMLILLNLIGWTYWTSTFVGNTVGAIVSYFLNRSFTFKAEVSYRRGIPKFVVIVFICYFIAYTLSEYMANHIAAAIPVPIETETLAILLGTCMYTLLNYMGQKYIVFSQKPLFRV
ncbi:hypothetical protein GCM10008967_41640 [Bacillus carboniphilus]|uniref:GtrA/DPMS transmembrane domain-containing protein n=1 Tax=Bacillus carboniphilus TaxID=86663 RepID=A0ABP3GJS6_9BACI